ncbi:MAG: flagellar protein FlgN [Syntrophomonadaceae bacterium]|nr:flagellar protein FlgN [Syntrophomonadaceae bacterium]
MKVKLEEFLRILTEQNRLVQGLVELAGEKRRLVILGQVRALDELLKKEGRLVLALERLEDERYRLQGELAGQMGMDVADLAASTLLAVVRERGFPGEDVLQEQLETLQAGLNSLKVLNRENEDLINQSLSFIRCLEDAITRGGSFTYSDKGALVGNRRKISLLDQKV